METSEPLTDDQLEIIARCEARLGYQFRDKAFLYEALTHASVADTRLNSYERMEFLGDSILGFTVCEYLFQKFPSWNEGDLTKVKSNVVSRQTCGQIGLELQLNELIVVGKGVEKQGTVPHSLLANAFESIVAAIYLDAGLEAVKGFLLPFVERHVESAIQGDLEINYKSALQQYAQKRFGLPPNYKLLGDRGPDHEKWFQIAAQIDKRSFAPAWGKNKKQAEQRAAANALAAIEGIELPFSEEE
jgi:ribonuclease-3